MQNKKLPRLAYLRECFTYNRRSGHLLWNERPLKHFVDARACASWNTRYAGTLAGSQNKKGYLHVKLFDSYWLLHRVIWKLATGKDPGKLTVDHKNTIKTDHRWSNLRLATVSEQNSNLNLSSASSTGMKGIYVCTFTGRWRAAVKKNGRIVGKRFTELEDAKAWLRKTRRQLHGAFANNG